MLFRQLEYLVALSRERHFARAAQACFVSQPALSEALRKLEKELDVPLVRRGRKYEGLTPEGERIVLWARRILADRDALKHEVGALRTGLSGQLRIGVVPTAAPVVPLLTEQFCAEHPLVTVQVASDLQSGDILARLRNFELDAGITYLDTVPESGFRVVPLYRERYVLLAAADMPVPVDGVSWSEASRLPLCLLGPEMQGRRVLDAVFAEVGVQPEPEVETDSLASLYAHVRTGRWAGIVPRAWVHVLGLPPGLRMTPLIEPVRTARVGLVATAGEPGSVMARALADIARHTDAEAVLDRVGEDPEHR
ncbi:LysR family transcriptional regulator [Prescottella sp. R16]|uniref:LysR family transcriptional regulator n=1 Tax=Prescottella sp. R16 TaxID=3064529 RepID=UPI00272E0DDD|nr:LysR family transcriptional regulator [Prescottella sp. R16]